MNKGKKKEERRPKIMVFGTFDGIHRGHLNFLRQAKNFMKNSFLIVSIARDKNVLAIKNEKPKLGEEERRTLVEKIGFVDKAILGGKIKYLPHILKEKPDVIALGYDQKAYVKNLRRDLKDNGASIKIVRLKPFKEHIYKNHLLKNKK